MKKILRKALALAAVGAPLVLGAYGCGGGGSAGDSAKAATGSATLTAALESGTLARMTPGGELAPLDVYAVNEQGEKVDSALGVTEALTLELPWEHDYVLIFSDARGILGAMVYGEAEQASFSVQSGVLALDLGRITIDPRKRRVKISDASRLRPPAGGPYPDQDDDGIPDHLDDDRDNDGIPNHLDTDDRGVDQSQDHDNDGVSTHDDDDDDDDGVADHDDDELNDHDNDGDDDDRDAGLGDAALGRQIWLASCAGCHGEGLEEASVREIAEALAEGEGRRMPRFRDLVANAPDLAAYLADPAAAGDGEVPPPPPPVNTDGDGDGVPDTADRCPTTFGTGSDGCPVVTPPPPPPSDGDGDGVPDAADRCPTTFGTGSDGCPVVEPPPPPPPPADRDGDGVPDATDACPTVPGTGADGCPPPPPPPADQDGDGVPDTADRCANTPAGVTVDATGCPLDRDGDGVPDYLDACPTQAGTGADGCPVVPPPPPPPTRPAILDTLCLGCHGNFSSRVSCTNSQWTRHDGSRVTAAQYQEVSTWATGGTCP